MQHAPNEGEDRAKLGITRPGVTDNFAPDTIFLCGERETGKGGGLEVRFGGIEEVEAGKANKKLDIGESERGGF